MSADAPLDPVEVIEIPFYDQTILAALVDPNTRLGRALYVPVRQLCDGLGLAWTGQQQRIRRDAILSRHARLVRVTRTTDTGGVPPALSLPLDRVNGWLLGINANRVKAEAREDVLRYQEELYDAVWDYCAHRAGLPVAGPLAALPDARQLAQDIRETRIGVDGILDVLWRRIQHDDATRRAVELTRQDLHEVGGLLEPGDTLTERQRRTLYQTGLEVALLLTQSGEPRNPYPLVFGGLKKRFGLGKREKYHAIPRDQYHAAHEYLGKWKADLQRKIRDAGDEPHIV